MMVRMGGIAAGLVCLMGWANLSYAQQHESAYLVNTVTNELAGKTVRFTSEKYGSGVFYFAQDGRAFLWRPGRLEILSGTWSGDRMQWLQGAEKAVTTVDVIAVTLQVGGKDQPELFGYFDASRLRADLGVTEVTNGDVLSLEDGTPPCRTCRADMTFARLLGG